MEDNKVRGTRVEESCNMSISKVYCIVYKGGV